MFFDVMRNSITILFFNEEVPVTKELIQRNVLVICYSLISLLCVYQITKRMFSDDDYNVITGTSLGYAKRVIRSENKMIRLLNIIGKYLPSTKLDMQ